MGESLPEVETGVCPPTHSSRHQSTLSWRALVATVLIAAGIAPPAPAHAGIEVLTTAENPTIAADTVVVRVTGTIESPMAEDLAALAPALATRYRRMLIDLDTPGGSLIETESLIATIALLRDTPMRIDSLVRHGAFCASACIALFVQGTDRAAGGASVWLFHGACRDPGENTPSLALTQRYLDILRKAGVSERFLCDLVSEGYVTTPGDFWLSGYELFHVYKANVITRLLEPWRPEAPRLPPINPWIGPH